MNFVQFPFLLAMTALAIPVLVHLLRRWQVQRIELGTMRFMQEVLVESSASRRISRWLLLATRSTLLAMIVLLFARPYWTATAERDGNKLRIVLIDRSASMAMPGVAGRLIDDALRAAKLAVADLGQNARVIWAWFDRQVEEIASDATNPPNPPVSLAGDTDYEAALKWARDRINKDRGTLCDLILITDLQQSGLSVGEAGADSLDFPQNVPVRLIDVGRPAASNLAITRVSTAAPTMPPDRPLKVQATLFNYGVLPLEEITVTLSATNAEWSRRTKKTVSLRGDQAHELEFDLGILEPGLWQIVIDADIDDDLAIDNRRRLAVQIAQPYPVLIVEPGAEGIPQSQSSFYLRTALDQSLVVASAPVKFKTLVNYAGAAVTGNLDSCRMIVLADASSVAPLQIEQLGERVRHGARLLVFAGNTIAPETSAAYAQAGLSPGKLNPQISAGVSPFRIFPVSTASHMLEPFQDPQQGDLGKLRFGCVLPADLDSGVRVLARFDSQHAAITEHSLGAGRVVWFLSSVDGSSGNWTGSSMFLPLVQQMVTDLLGLTGEGPVRARDVGDLTSQPVLNAPRSSHNETSRYETRRYETRRYETPGFYSVGDATVAVNTSARESDPTRKDVESFYRQFKLTAFDNDFSTKTSVVSEERRDEFWPWVAAGVLLLLLVEFCLANRTPA